MCRVLRGALAGTVATLPMTAVMKSLHERLPGEPARPLPPREVTESLAAQTGVRDEVSEPEMQVLTLVSHFGYGALCGAIFGTMAPRRLPAAVGCGVAFGLAVWAGSYLRLLPALNLRHHARHDPPARSGLMIAAHITWGAVAGLAMASPGREQHA